MNQSYLCRVLRGRYRAAETRLRGTRTQKCRFFVISGELLGFTEHFRTRDFSRTPRRDRCKSRWVKATFASSSPICPATQSSPWGLVRQDFALDLIDLPALRAHRKRPCHRAAEQRHERAPLHSITSSARASSAA